MASVQTVYTFRFYCAGSWPVPRPRFAVAGWLVTGGRKAVQRTTALKQHRWRHAATHDWIASNRDGHGNRTASARPCAVRMTRLAKEAITTESNNESCHTQRVRAHISSQSHLHMSPWTVTRTTWGRVGRFCRPLRWRGMHRNPSPAGKALLHVLLGQPSTLPYIPAASARTRTS